MLVTVLSNDLLHPELNNRVTVHKLALEPDLVIQGEIHYAAENHYNIYPKYVGKLISKQKQLPLSCLVGRTIFNGSRKLGKTGVTFGLSVYESKAPNRSVVIDCVAFKSTAEMIQQYAKDTTTGLTGRFSFETYRGNVKPKLFVNGFSLISF